MRDLVFLAIFIIAIPIAFSYAEFAVAYWYWVSLYQPQTQSWGFAGSLPFGLTAGVISLLSWATTGGRKIPPFTPMVVTIILMGIWTTLTTINAVFPKVAYTNWNIFVSIIVMVLVGIALLQTRAKVEILVWTICISIGYYGFKTGLFGLKGGLGESFHGPSYMNANNELARGMMFVIPLLYYLFATRKELWLKIGLAAVAAGSALTILLSGSRGAWLGTIAMVGFVAVRTKKGLLWVCLALAVGAAALPLLPDRIVDRFMTINDYKTDGSVQGRFGSWEYALEKFPERPLMGGGFNIFEAEHNKASHNSFFEVLGEHGAVGELLFLFLLFAAARATIEIKRVAKRNPDLEWAGLLAYMIQIILVGYVVGSISINQAFFPIFYAVLGTLASLQIVVRNTVTETKAPEVKSRRRKREPFRMPQWPPVSADVTDQ